jgi:putative transcriptional regulator
MKRENLQIFRKENELTQEQMARELNVTVAHYKAIEYGIRNPSFEFMERLKIRFPKCSIDKIFYPISSLKA